jgi:hypothetical protein
MLLKEGGKQLEVRGEREWKGSGLRAGVILK